MQQKKKTKINKITIDTNKRIIFVSDIHGDVDLLKEGLNRVCFSENDFLFIIGDIIEKGDFHKNLETFRYVYELSKRSNVFAMSGNCDEIFRFIYAEDDKQKSIDYLTKKGKSILNDMAYEMKIVVNQNIDINDFVEKAFIQYKELIDFADNLDDVVIINDQIVLVHGGIADIDNIPDEAIDVLKFDRFYEKSAIQKKLMIVGHYPTRNYRADISSCNPIFDFKKRIISIDGGNHVAKGGQLNFVILESMDTMKFSFIYVDHYPKYLMKETVNYDIPSNSFNITFGDNEVEILDTDLDFYYIKHIKTQECMWVHVSFVYENPMTKRFYCYDGSNHFVSVTKNDEVSIIKKAMPYSLIKKNGLIGLIESRYLPNEI